MMEGIYSKKRTYDKLDDYNTGCKLKKKWTRKDWCDVIWMTALFVGLYLMIASGSFSSGWYISKYANQNQTSCIPQKCQCNYSGGTMIPTDWIKICKRNETYCQFIYSPTCNYSYINGST